MPYETEALTTAPRGNGQVASREEREHIGADRDRTRNVKDAAASIGVSLLTGNRIANERQDNFKMRMRPAMRAKLSYSIAKMDTF